MPDPFASLERVATVLVEPQSADNIGGALRALRNMGLRDLRLVRPAPFDAARLIVAAHRSQPQVAALRVFDDLGAALADVHYVIGTTGRRRATRRPVLTAREAAIAVQSRAVHDRVALLFGREDLGLSNADLDHCHALLTIPTSPEYASLNLAQAVLLVAYEVRLAATSGQPGPTMSAPPASSADTEALFAALEATLTARHFLVPSRAEATLRALRAVLLRAEPTVEEVALLTAMLRALAGGRQSRGPKGPADL